MIYSDGIAWPGLAWSSILALPRPTWALHLGTGRAYGKVETTALQGATAAPSLGYRTIVAVQWPGGHVSKVEREAVICLQ